MAKHQKALDKLCSVPVSANIKWDELRAVLENFGYNLIKNNGSRRMIYHKEKDALIICYEPHPQPTVDKECVADVIEHLKTYGFI